MWGFLGFCIHGRRLRIGSDRTVNPFSPRARRCGRSTATRPPPSTPAALTSSRRPSRTPSASRSSASSRRPTPPPPRRRSGPRSGRPQGARFDRACECVTRSLEALPEFTSCAGWAWCSPGGSRREGTTSSGVCMTLSKPTILRACSTDLLVTKNTQFLKMLDSG